MAYIFENEKNKFVYVHIPKTGGTTLEHELTNSNLNCDFFKLRGHLNLNDCKQTLGEHDDVIWVSTIRNPWSWYVSWYFWLQTECDIKDLDLKIEMMFAKNNSFSKFIEFIYINRNILNFKNGGMKTLKFNQFSKWLNYPETPVEILKLEFFNRDVKRFSKKYNLSLSINTQLRRSIHEKYQFYYDNETKKTVFKMHETDIELFKYKF